MAPQADGYYTFTGVGTVQPLLVGIVRKLASPREFDTLRNPVITVGFDFSGSVRLAS